MILWPTCIIYAAHLMASYGTLIVEPEDQNMIDSTYCSIINSHKMVVILHVTSSLGVNASTIHNTSSISKVLITFFFFPAPLLFLFFFSQIYATASVTLQRVPRNGRKTCHDTSPALLNIQLLSTSWPRSIQTHSGWKWAWAQRKCDDESCCRVINLLTGCIFPRSLSLSPPPHTYAREHNHNLMLI